MPSIGRYFQIWLIKKPFRLHMSVHCFQGWISYSSQQAIKKEWCGRWLTEHYLNRLGVLIKLRQLDFSKNKVIFIGVWLFFSVTYIKCWSCLNSLSSLDKVLVSVGVAFTSRWLSVRPSWPAWEHCDVDLSHRKNKQINKQTRNQTRLCCTSNCPKYVPVQDSQGCRKEKWAPEHFPSTSPYSLSSAVALFLMLDVVRNRRAIPRRSARPARQRRAGSSGSCATCHLGTSSHGVTRGGGSGKTAPAHLHTSLHIIFLPLGWHFHAGQHLP